MKKIKHTPLSAAKAVRVLLKGSIPTDWDEYFDGKHEANAYQAALLVMEQCNGPQKDKPVSFKKASLAVQAEMPELFANYWEKLGGEKQTVEQRITRIEKTIGSSVHGTILSRNLGTAPGIGWCLSVGHMAHPKQHFFGKTIDEVITMAEKELNIK